MAVSVERHRNSQSDDDHVQLSSSDTASRKFLQRAMFATGFCVCVGGGGGNALCSTVLPLSRFQFQTAAHFVRSCGSQKRSPDVITFP